MLEYDVILHLYPNIEVIEGFELNPITSLSFSIMNTQIYSQLKKPVQDLTSSQVNYILLYPLTFSSENDWNRLWFRASTRIKLTVSRKNLR